MDFIYLRFSEFHIHPRPFLHPLLGTWRPLLDVGPACATLLPLTMQFSCFFFGNFDTLLGRLSLADHRCQTAFWVAFQFLYLLLANYFLAVHSHNNWTCAYLPPAPTNSTSSCRRKCQFERFSFQPPPLHVLLIPLFFIVLQKPSN